MRLIFFSFTFVILIRNAFYHEKTTEGNDNDSALSLNAGHISFTSPSSW